MSFGKNLQHLRRLSGCMTQEQLAEKLGVSRQTVSKWEMDSAQPEITKAMELCSIFNCTLDNLFREELDGGGAAYSNLRLETLPPLRFVRYTVISPDPEGDALGHLRALAARYGVKKPELIGWDFPFLSQEQINVYHMHGYTAAWVLPEGLTPEGMEVLEQDAQLYAAIHIDNPFNNPFVTIPHAYRTLMNYIRLNGMEHCENVPIRCFETEGQSMDVYIACK